MDARITPLYLIRSFEQTSRIIQGKADYENNSSFEHWGFSSF
jgi:hypothetical protein